MKELKPVLCTECPFLTSFLFSLKNHVNRKHKFDYLPRDQASIKSFDYYPCAGASVEKYTCPGNDFQTPLKILLYKHSCEVSQRSTVVQNIKRKRCSNCNFATHSQLILNDHECETVCKRMFLRHALLESRILEEEVPRKIFNCEECSFISTNKNHIEQHIVGMHISTEDLKWTYCAYCSFKTEFESTIRKHLQEHMEIKWFKCQQCSYKAKKEYILKRHVTVKHMRDEKKTIWFYCSQCEFKSTTEDTVKLHITQVKELLGTTEHMSITFKTHIES